MPGRAVHTMAGAGVGAGLGVLVVGPAPDHQMRQMAVFSTLGGALGGAMPDLLEPATSPNHRDVCHGLIFTAAVCFGLYALWAGTCRTRAAACDERAASLELGSDARYHEEARADFWRALGALALGFAAGYASHVALDGGTPDGIPLLARAPSRLR